MQPPIAGQTVLGWDPAFRTGCKLAVVDPTGKVLDTTVVYPTAPTNEKKIRAAKDTVEAMIKKYHISLISVGNGTASRESEQVIVDMLKEIGKGSVCDEMRQVLPCKKATEEFSFDVTEKCHLHCKAGSLAELVKIDPKSIGVGQYQHDMNQKKLGEALTGVVEDSVNKVGVDLNTTSFARRCFKAIAKNIVAEEWPFQRKDRRLRSGPKALSSWFWTGGYQHKRSPDMNQKKLGEA